MLPALDIRGAVGALARTGLAGPQFLSSTLLRQR
jgi:hypothetical protein